MPQALATDRPSHHNPLDLSGIHAMLHETLLFLSAVWPTVLSIGLVLTTLFVAWRSATALPGTRGRKPKRPTAIVEEPRQEGELPLWRGG